jgi:hypothetical protein
MADVSFARSASVTGRSAFAGMAIKVSAAADIRRRSF